MTSRVEALLKEMTIEEKVGQLSALFTDAIMNYDGSNTYLEELNLGNKKVFTLGAITGILEGYEVKAVIDKYMENSRLKIPPLMMTDVVHGFELHYPNANALGCMFDHEMVYDLSKMSAKEASLNGINLTYSPMADITNDPRWGRIMESPSEDLLITKNYTDAIVRGFQNDSDYSLASCVKHIAGYGLSEGGRDYETCDASSIAMYNKYLVGYKAAIDAGCKMVMTSFNVYDYIPSTVNEHLLKDIVRGEMGFDGVIISDHSSIEQVTEHGVAETPKEAAKLAINATVDLELATSCYSKYLAELVQEGEVSIETIDDSVRRILMLKEEMGLFENPYGALDLEEGVTIRDDEQNKQLVKSAAIKSSVLLKHNHLPLKESDEVILTGPLSTSRRLIGFNGCLENVDKTKTLDEIFSQQLKNYKLIDGIDFENNSDDTISKAVYEIGTGKTVVMAMGEFFRFSGEGVSHANIQIDKSQVKYIKEVAKNNKVILVVFSGRPLDLSNIIDDVDDVIFAWFGGSMHATAVYELVFGYANPSGKLSFTFPRNVGQLPLYYNKLNTGRPVTQEHAEYESTYRDELVAPLFEFGFGLSYSDFGYKIISHGNKITPGGKLEIEVEVTNNSDVDGVEIMQMYLRDNVAIISRPIKELKAYERVALKGGETKTVTFEIDESMFEFYGPRLDLIKEFGKFTCYIGNSSATTDSFVFDYVKEQYDPSLCNCSI